MVKFSEISRGATIVVNKSLKTGLEGETKYFVSDVCNMSRNFYLHNPIEGDVKIDFLKLPYESITLVK